MLHEICRVSGYQDDDFIGLKFVDGKPQVTFPRGYRLGCTDAELRSDVLNLLGAIKKFTTREEGNETPEMIGSLDSSYPLRSYQYIILDFLQNGYYLEKETRYVDGTRGRINWKRTIQTKQVQIDNGNAVYLDFAIRVNRTNDNNLITRIHEYCVYESFVQLGWLYFPSSLLPPKPRIALNKRIFESVLRKEMHNTFDDKKKHLFTCMLNVIAGKSETLADSTVSAFGVDRFEYIWEGMIDYVFGESNREDYYPKAHWHIVRQNVLHYESSELRPETIMKYQDNLFILDAKYYKFGITGHAGHLPNTDSIQKQITYGKYAEQQKFAHPNRIYNAFLMPFQADKKSQNPYKFVSVGTADWYTYKENSPNYQYVLGILVDTKYLVSNYARLCTSDIHALSALIMESLKEFRSISKGENSTNG